MRNANHFTCASVLARTGVLSVLLLAAGPVAAADWPHWRGPSRQDVTTENSGWSNGRWADENPVWTARVGEGSTSPVIAGGKLYVLGWEGGQDHVRCLDARTGKPLWTTSYRCPQHGRHASGDEGLYGGPTATPEYDAGTHYLYTLSCDGDLHCWDTRGRGRRVWGLNLYDRFHAGQRPPSKLEPDDRRDYGYTTAPCVHGEWVVVEVGAPEGNLMAFDKRTGERRWTSEYRGPAGHTGGLVPMTVEGVPCLAVFTLRDLVVVRLDRGKEGRTVAQYPWPTAYAGNILTPAAEGNGLLIGSQHTHQSICKLRITLRGAQRLWERPYSSHIGSPVVYAGRVYLANERLLCLDWETGQLVWGGGSYGTGGACVATGDGRLVVWSDRGHADLVEGAARSPHRFQRLGRIRRVFYTDHAWPHIALADGLLYCKNLEGELKCFATAPPHGGAH
jgi:outer membrane protein assembly factor BamB